MSAGVEECITIAGYDVPSDRAAIVCKHIVEKADILLFSHDGDGTMQFLCGCEPSVDNGRVAHVGHVLEQHPDLGHLPLIQPGYEAERASTTSPWIVSRSIEITDADALNSSRKGLNP